MDTLTAALNLSTWDNLRRTLIVNDNPWHIRLFGLLVVSLLSAILSSILQGIAVGLDNNVYQIPIVLKIYDLPQFSDDFYMQSLRRYTSWVYPLLGLFCNEQNVNLVFVSLTLLTRAANIFAMLLVADTLGLRSWRAWALVAAALVIPDTLYARSPVGVDGIFVGWFTHTELAQAFGITAFCLCIREWLVAAACCWAIAFDLNVFVGAWCIVPMLLLVMDLVWRQRWFVVRQVAYAGAAALLLVVPNLIWVGSVIRSQTIDFPYERFLREFFPYHFMIDTASPAMEALLGLFVISGGLGLWLHGWPRRWVLVYAGLLAVFVIGMPLPWLTESPDLLNLHLLRVDGMVVMLGTTFAVSGLVRAVVLPGSGRGLDYIVPTAFAGLLLGYRPLAAATALGGHQSSHSVVAGVTHAASAALGGDPRIFWAAAGVALAAVATLLFRRRPLWPMAMVLTAAAAIAAIFGASTGPTWLHLFATLALIGLWMRFYASAFVHLATQTLVPSNRAMLPVILLAWLFLLLPFRHGQPASDSDGTVFVAAVALAVGIGLVSIQDRRPTVLAGSGLAVMAVVHGLICGYGVGAPSTSVGAFPFDEQLMGLRPVAPAWRDVQLWARAHTEPNATFLTPSNLSGFEIGALRKNWFDARRGAAVMWSHAYYHEWRRRRDQVADLGSLGAAWGYACENGIDYIVADRRPAAFATQSDPGSARITADADAGLGVAYSNASFAVYRAGPCPSSSKTERTRNELGAINGPPLASPHPARRSPARFTACARFEPNRLKRAAHGTDANGMPLQYAQDRLLLAAAPGGASTTKADAYRHSFLCDSSAILVDLLVIQPEAAMSSSTTSAPTAASFINALGVNVHLNYGDTAYANSQTVLNDVSYLGFTKVRDHTPSLDAASMAPYALLATHGITFDLDAPAGAVDPNAFVTQLKGFVAKLPGALAAIEGSNETNLEPVTYNGLSGMAASAALQQAIYGAVKADGQLSSLPVYNTTLGGASQDQYSQLGNLSSYCDFGNAHIYPSGGPVPSDYIAANITWETHDTPGKATVITEGGYFTMPGVSRWEGVSQDVQARYTLDYVLDAAAQGVPATYLYELLDERPDPGNTDREQHFGLFNNDGTPKQAATALHNLTTLLADPGNKAATATGVAYTVSNLPAAGHTLELVKASGASDLIVWAEPSLWNQATGTAIAASTSNVTVNLGGTMQSVQVFDPLLGTAPIAQLSNVSSVNLAVSDHPLIVEVKPNGTTPVIPPTPTSDTLELRLSEDAWQVDAQFTISVDGAQIGGVRTVSATHATGTSQVVSLGGSWGSGSHNVGIAFINDAYGGTAATDRNLFVGSIAYDGKTDAGTSASLYSNGTANLTVGGGSQVAAAPADRLTLHLSEDAWQGDAQFTVTIDGRQVNAPAAVTTLHSSGQAQDFTFTGAFGAGAHTVGVSFVNDAWGGTAATDRNLYIGGMDVNGTAAGGGAVALLSNGTQHYSITTTA